MATPRMSPLEGVSDPKMDRGAYAQAIETLRSQREELHQLQQDYKALEIQLRDLTAKSNYQILVPVCGSNQVLVPGRVINTNAVLCQLAQDHFVKRTPMNCLEKSVVQRRQMADALLVSHDRQINDLQDKQSLLKQTGPTETARTPKGSITRNAEGYLEIIEREDDVQEQPSERRRNEQLPSEPQLIEEVKPMGKSVSKIESEKPAVIADKPASTQKLKSLVGQVIERVPERSPMPAAERNSTGGTQATNPRAATQKSRFAQEFGR